MSSYVLVSFDSFKLIEFMRKINNRETGYLAGGDQFDFVRYIKENLVLKLKECTLLGSPNPQNRQNQQLSDICSLVAFITPFSYENITINNPMR